MSGRLPAGACDAHCHIFGPQTVFPFAEGRTYTPTDAPWDALLALHRRLGLDRAVLVQPGAHGLDHSAILDAIARSDGAWRGVALAAEDATEADLAELHAGGVRGLRFNFVPHLGAPPTPAGFRRLSAMAGDLGWHIALHLTLNDLPVAETYLDGLPTPFVIDHMGRPNAADGGPGQAGFQRLLALLERPTAWVKISGADRASRQSAPFADAAPFMDALIAAAPDRVVWGADWPHPNVRGEAPDEDDLIDLLLAVVTDPANRQAILVDNPARLFGFPPLASTETA
jgi:2-pyrone-4,6-dicarboxylate lactonase